MAKIIGIDANWWDDAKFGLFLGLGFVALNLISPTFAIGYPMVSVLIAQFLVILLVAPIVEEILFRSTLLSYAKMGPSTPQIVFAVLITAFLFSVFHWQAYGVGLQTAFVGAGLFGIIAGWVAIDRQSVLPVIIMHIIFNAWLFAKASLAIGI